MADPRGFLERWSRLKRAGIEKSSSRGKAVAENAAAKTAPTPAASPAEDPVADLPPLETLTKDSDFRAFMRPGVPEALRNQALRKLWGSDPVYANLDGLLEYGEDFAEPFRMVGVVATVYRVLEGMPAAEKPAEPPPEAPRAQSAAASDQTADPAPAAETQLPGGALITEGMTE